MTQVRNKTEDLLKELNKLSGLKLSVASDPDMDPEDELQRLLQLVEACRASESRETLLQKFITGNESEEEFKRKAALLHFDREIPRALYYMETGIRADASVIRFLKHALADRQGLLLLPAGDHSLILLETRKGKHQETLRDTAETVVSLLNTEMFTDVKIAVSRTVSRADLLPEAFRETVHTLEAGKLFYPDKNVFVTGEPGEETLLYDLSPETCRAYLRDVLEGASDPVSGPSKEENGKTETAAIGSLQAFSGDLLNTAECFLKNDLNIAETARQLHMHRNTLLYRIEQIRQETGLDIRRFEDAMRYRLCGMVQKRLLNRK